MKTIKGPAIFLAQFMGDTPPFDTLENITADVSIEGADLGANRLRQDFATPRPQS